MTVDRDPDYLISLVHELRKLPKETEWAEFKHNIAEADEIGEYISALSNSAALCGKASAYLIWGMEITNPGVPLVDTRRFLDTPPRSRNEALASFMRRIGVCEERGSGIDKVVFETEFYQLPAPEFEITGENT